MEIPVTAIADSIKRGDILLSEFDGIDHRKQKRTTSVVGRMKDEHINVSVGSGPVIGIAAIQQQLGIKSKSTLYRLLCT